jgi:cbb3-type cytochrome oxidase subunit 1
MLTTLGWFLFSAYSAGAVGTTVCSYCELKEQKEPARAAFQIAVLNGVFWILLLPILALVVLLPSVDEDDY